MVFYVNWYNLSKCLMRYCEPFTLLNADDPDFPVSRRGSASRVKYRNREFLYATEHQLERYDPQDVGIINPDNQNFVSSNACQFSRAHVLGGTIHDLRMYDFSESVRAGALANSGWFDLRRHFVEGERVALTIALGYPHLDRNIDYDNRDIPLSPRAVFGNYTGTSIAGLESMDINPALDYDPDGFSGGPFYWYFTCVRANDI